MLSPNPFRLIAANLLPIDPIDLTHNLYRFLKHCILFLQVFPLKCSGFGAINIMIIAKQIAVLNLIKK